MKITFKPFFELIREISFLFVIGACSFTTDFIITKAEQQFGYRKRLLELRKFSFILPENCFKSVQGHHTIFTKPNKSLDLKQLKSGRVQVSNKEGERFYENQGVFKLEGANKDAAKVKLFTKFTTAS